MCASCIFFSSRDLIIIMQIKFVPAVRSGPGLFDDSSFPGLLLLRITEVGLVGSLGVFVSLNNQI